MARSYATDKAPTDDTRMVVFTNTASSCEPGTALPAQNALIYFVARNSRTNTYDLYRRTITNITGGTLCDGIAIYQKQTCGATYVLTYSSVCGGSDAVIMTDVDRLHVDYFTSSNDSQAMTCQYTTTTPCDIAAAKSVRITVDSKRRVNGKEITSSSSIRISRPY